MNFGNLRQSSCCTGLLTRLTTRRPKTLPAVMMRNHSSHTTLPLAPTTSPASTQVAFRQNLTTGIYPTMNTSRIQQTSSLCPKAPSPSTAQPESAQSRRGSHHRRPVPWFYLTKPPAPPELPPRGSWVVAAAGPKQLDLTKTRPSPFPKPPPPQSLKHSTSPPTICICTSGDRKS